MALTYIIGSGVALFLGFKGKQLFNKEEKTEENIEFDLLEKELNEINGCLGESFKERMETMIKVCKNKCGINIDKHKSKHRLKILRYIKEYEKYGHNSFIKNHKKKQTKICKIMGTDREHPTPFHSPSNLCFFCFFVVFSMVFETF